MSHRAALLASLTVTLVIAFTLVAAKSVTAAGKMLPAQG